MILNVVIVIRLIMFCFVNVMTDAHEINDVMMAPLSMLQKCCLVLSEGQSYVMIN